jgi:hypothetical protein
MRTTYGSEHAEAEEGYKFLKARFPGLNDSAQIMQAGRRFIDLTENQLLHLLKNKLYTSNDRDCAIVCSSILGLHSFQMFSATGEDLTDEELQAYVDATRKIAAKIDHQSLIARMVLAEFLLGQDFISIGQLWRDYMRSRNDSELSVLNYLEELRSLGAKNFEQQVLKGIGTAELSRVVRSMRDAKIFDIEPKLYEQAQELLFDKTLDELGVDLSNENVDRHAYEAEHLMGMLSEWAFDAPMPEERPFENVYLAYRGGAELGPVDQQLHFHRIPEAGFMLERCLLMGHLIDSRGCVWTFLRAHIVGETYDEEGWSHLLAHERNSGRWCNSVTMVPWTVPTFLELIDEYKTVSLEPMRLGKDVRKALKKAKKPGKKGWAHQPQPYYHVKLRALTIRHKILGPDYGFPSHLTYRHDVRSHVRLRVRRGPLPLIGRDREELYEHVSHSGNKYEVFEEGELPEDITREFRRRSIPVRRSGEWVAVMQIRVKQHQKGPEGSPYVPALRILDIDRLPDY